MPGPPPKPDSQRVRRAAPLASSVTRLPAEGRRGDVPDWPFGDDAPDLWRQLWATPQAAAWQRLGWTRVVARYCMVLLSVEREPTAAMLGEVRQLEDRLGLSPMAMLRLRWEIASDEVAEQRETGGSKAKTRLKVVAADALAGA
jgi:hypothetical protein